MEPLVDTLSGVHGLSMAYAAWFLVGWVCVACAVLYIYYGDYLS